ncbi:MAG: hypothetical protein WCK86_16030, partial [Planctomycetia bacterium]
QQTGRPHDQLFWRAGQQHAARVGDWKLVNTRIEPPMIFNLKEDISESNDLAATQPEKLKELQTAFAEWEKITKPAQWTRQDGRTQVNPAKRKAGSRIQDALRNADRNADGKLSREEFPQPAIFKDVDQDNDGFATREEIRTYYASRRNSGTPNQ